MSAKLESKALSEATFFGFLRRQFTKPKPLPADIKLNNRVAIVTGSNVGIGLETSRQLLGLGLSHLVMGVRSQSKGDAAAALLRTAFPSSTISVWLLDLESYDSVHAFAAQCATLPRIDITILNSGMLAYSYTVSPTTKHEVMTQVNYLSTALLSYLLLPILKAKRASGAARPPVLTIVGSDGAYTGEVNTSGPVLSQFDQPKGFKMLPRYYSSKLLLLFFFCKLAKLVSPDEVLVNMVNPGMTAGTAFSPSSAPVVLVKIFDLYKRLLARPVAVAATIYIDAVVVRGKESHGSFLSDWAIKP